LTEGNRERGIDIDSTTIDSRWLGERMDYGMAIDALIAAREGTRARTRTRTRDKAELKGTIGP
jgi:hypothetical protein